MTIPPARLAFVKLNVERMEEALAFWSAAFSFTITGTFDTPEFLEHILALPGQAESGPTLMLVEARPPAPVPVGPGHGPVGLVVVDIAASHAHALACGARELLAPFDAGGVLVAMLAAPQGHEIELVQML